jgi:hypothetical protein
MKENDDGGILSAEQVTALQKKYPRPKTPAERKQAQRTRDKEKAEITAAMSQAETVQQFWSESLKLADPAKLAEWKAIEEQVTAQLGAMRDCLEGRAFDDQFILDVDEDTKAMLEKNGEAGVTPVLLIPKFWQEPNTTALFIKNDATSVFARYGLLIGLPDIRVHEWKGFIVSRSSKSTAISNDYVAMKCNSCNLPTGVESVPRSIAEQYAALHIKFECSACRAKETVSRAVSRTAVGQETLYQSPDSHALFDEYGRVRDNG